jgi:protein gp37
MGKSHIGYCGIGADGRPVEWMYGWNPGGCGCSAGCDGCWARAMPFKGATCPDCRAFRVHMHPERLGQPAATRRAGVVLCNFTNDWCDRLRAACDRKQMVSAMTAAEQHTYVTLTKQPGVLAALRHDMPSMAHEFDGLTIRTQKEADEKLAAFLSAAIPSRWLSLEPLHGPVDLSATLLTRSLDIHTGRLGMLLASAKIKGVIIGHDNRRGRPGTDTLAHVRNVVKQCQAAGVRVFVKQLWLTKCKSCGDFSHGPNGCPSNGTVVRRLYTDVAEFPADLQLRDLPWSLPLEAK